MVYPYKIWSLLAMLRFYADQFLAISQLLTQLNQFLKLTPDHIKDINLDNVPNHDYSGVYQQFINMDLTMCVKSMKRFIEYMQNNSPLSKSKLIQLTEDLNQRFVDELENRLIFIVPSEKGNFYNPDKMIFGEEVSNKLPELIEDIVESGNCYALGRYTACVFHLMRVMEKSIQKYAENLGIPLTLICDKEWQLIINDIRGQLNKLYTKHADPGRVKHESILGHLETVKIAWRNPTMHPKATYTEEEARALLSAVEIFVKDLVKIL